jgi:DNA helicase MCM8
MSGPILSRFDLVFILLDKPDQNRDKYLSEHIMQVNHLNLKILDVSAWKGEYFIKFAE